ncbi:hypothetical protein [Enterococcus faecalis]|uniref:hypothetical protein n=1 Tax=Enterococcus faecalis TaxID=1351 RepID=UPI0003534D03|nr:hypothetical protein [Enterococcus faecalis]EPI34313.1 hypothetical protein D348_02702 [Enterococcus faecalis SLO2C-1]
MEDLIKEINQFRDDRDWRQFHNAKDLALSVSLEASELLENFQWKSSEEAIADDLGLSVEEIIKNKIKKNGEKYTIEKSKGTNKKRSVE